MQKESEVKNGKLGINSLRSYKVAMNVLREAHGKQLVECIGNEWVQDLFNSLSALPLASTSKNNRWTIWQAFLDYLDTMGLITKPKLLSKLSFPHEASKKKSPWSVAEYQKALADANRCQEACVAVGCELCHVCKRYGRLL